VYGGKQELMGKKVSDGSKEEDRFKSKKVHPNKDDH
jgi:hypothetical protein